MAEEEFPGVKPYTLASGEVRYFARVRRSDGTMTMKRGFRTSRAAHRYRESRQSAARKGEVATVPRGSFAGCFDRWLARRAPYLAAGTLADYKVHGEKRLKPAFGDKRLDRIDREDIEDLVDELLEDYAPKTVNNCLKVLTAFLNYCVERGWLSRSPVLGVDCVAPEHIEMDYLRADEVPRYLDACRSEYRPLAELLIGSGLRISEALGLLVEDFDPDTCVVRVLRQRKKGAEGRRGRQRAIDTAATKGKRYRVVQIGPRVARTLSAYLARRGEFAPLRPQDALFVTIRPAPDAAYAVTARARERRERIMADLRAVHAGHEKWTQAEIARRHGVGQPLVSLCRRALMADQPEPMNRDTVSRSWHREALRLAGIRPLRLHDLRHTAAALWLGEGLSLVFVQRQLGHASITTTQRYAHLEKHQINDALVWLERRVHGSVA